jgi:Protein of unknown function (DUF455)
MTGIEDVDDAAGGAGNAAADAQLDPTPNVDPGAPAHDAPPILQPGERLGDLGDCAWMRHGTAEVLARFFYLERAVTVAAAGWITRMHRVESKAALARLSWQSALTADALRERVFELRYPQRLLLEGTGAPLIRLFDAAVNAPSQLAFALGLRDVLLPALRDGYDRYLAISDELADGPSLRFVDLARREKIEHVAALDMVVAAEPSDGLAFEVGARWAATMDERMVALGGITREVPDGGVDIGVGADGVFGEGRPFTLPDEPARDDRFRLCGFYWPDILDPSIDYGDHLTLQLRAAVSHLNEAWAVETAGAVLQSLADELGWEFVREAARWTYDESRHMLMGRERLRAWGLPEAGIPLSPFIYEACRDQDPMYRLGMLGYFETKNIHKKPQRARAFDDMGDDASRRHMEFDWADETIHAEYGRRWLKALLERRGQPADDWPAVLQRCEELVAARVAAATDEDRRVTREVAEALVGHAQDRVAGAGL